MFDPIRSYDKPAVIISQLANGIATTDSVSRVLFDPASLSPRERETFVQRMKDLYGGNAVSDTVIDVFTNPFVWLGMLTMGTGGVAARNLAVGRRFFAGGTGGHWAGKMGVENFPILRQLGLTSGATDSIGRKIAPLAQVLARKTDDTSRKLVGVIEPELRGLLERVGRKHNVRLNSLDPDLAPNQAVARDLRDILDVLDIKRLAFDRERSEKVIAARSTAPARHFVRIRADPTNPANKKLRTVEVDQDTFDGLKEAFRGDTKRTLSRLNPEKAALLKRIVVGTRREDIAGLGPTEVPETAYDLMERVGVDALRVKLGANPKRVDPTRDPEAVFIDPASNLAGGVKPTFTRITRPRYVADDEAIESVVREFDLGRFMEAENKLYLAGKVLVAGNEAEFARTGNFVIDRDKVLRLAQGQLMEMRSSNQLTESGVLTADGQETLRALLTDDVASSLIRASKRSKGGVKLGSTAKEIEDVVVEAMSEGFMDPNYRPRNTVEARDATGARIAYNPYTGKVAGEETQGIGARPTGRTFARTRTTEVPWDPDDLRRIADRFGGTDQIEELIAEQRARVQGQIANQNFYRTMRLRPDIAADKYVSSTARDYAYYAMDAATDPMVRVTLKDFVPAASNVRYPGPTGRRERGGVVATTRSLEGVPEEQRPAGGYNLAMLIDTELRSTATERPGDKYSSNLWRKHILPAITGIRPLDDGTHIAVAGQIRQGVERLANSRFMKAIEAKGGHSGRFVTDMRRWATDSTGMEFMPMGAITRSLYVSHMGLNLGTVLVNMLQPLQSVHQLGFNNTVNAYGQSIEMIGNYIQERVKLGLRPTADARNAAMQRAFKRSFGGQDVDLTQIADISSTFDMLERSGYGARIEVGNPKFRFLEMMMKPFQLSETLNRTVTANAVLNAYQRANRVMGDDFYRAQLDATQAVQQFQFGTNPINRPSLFYAPVLREPAFRQFAQYGIRSFANLFTVPAMMGGTRSFAGREVSGKLGTTLVDTARLMAVSAVTYEVFKSALGVDVSRGLAFGMTDLVGGQQALSGDEPKVYVPPVVDIGFDAVKLLATQDVEILKDIAPRVLPGGIALSRALGSMGPSETLQALGLQKTYADWSQAQGGMVPVFKSDGRFVGQYPTSDVVLKSFGADLGRFGNPQEVSQFLLKNRDAIREGRRQYIASVLGNNLQAAGKVKREFERRFGMPLTVTQEQLKQAIKVREESVVGRTLESIDKTARDVYRQSVEEYAPGQLMEAQVPGERGDIYRWSQQPRGGQRENQS